MCVRQRCQHDGVDDRIDRRCGSDADRERHDGQDGNRSGRLPGAPGLREDTRHQADSSAHPISVVAVTDDRRDDSARLQARCGATPATLPVMLFSRLAALPVKRPSATLLLVQVLSILLYPLMQDTAVERGVFRVIGFLVLGAALYVVK